MYIFKACIVVMMVKGTSHRVADKVGQIEACKGHPHSNISSHGPAGALCHKNKALELAHEPHTVFETTLMIDCLKIIMNIIHYSQKDVYHVDDDMSPSGPWWYHVP